jgi:hypothetical protein
MSFFRLVTSIYNNSLVNINILLKGINIMKPNHAMGSSDVSWSGDTSVPSQYASLPASEARERIAQDKIKAEKRKEEMRKLQEDRKVAERVAEALKEAGVEPEVEEVVEVTGDSDPIVETTSKSFSASELATVTNKVFELSASGSVSVSQIGQNGIKLVIDGVSVLITKE